MSRWMPFEWIAALRFLREGRMQTSFIIAGVTIGVGEIVGETALITTGTRTATVRAASDVTALLVTRETLERELEGRGWLETLVTALARRFAEADQERTSLRESTPKAAASSEALEVTSRLAASGAVRHQPPSIRETSIRVLEAAGWRVP